MTIHKIIIFLQCFVLTRWIWRYWQHEDTGHLIMLPLWKNPGKRWYKCDLKE